jgi:hypothetical protein
MLIVTLGYAVDVSSGKRLTDSGSRIFSCSARKNVGRNDGRSGEGPQGRSVDSIDYTVGFCALVGIIRQNPQTLVHSTARVMILEMIRVFGLRI